MLAAVVVLVPGLLLYVALRAIGLAIGPAGLLGLLLMIVGMAAYPAILRRTGWVGPARRAATQPARRSVDSPGEPQRHAHLENPSDSDTPSDRERP
jgi:hypothetical protein